MLPERRRIFRLARRFLLAAAHGAHEDDGDGDGREGEDCNCEPEKPVAPSASHSSPLVWFDQAHRSGARLPMTLQHPVRAPERARPHGHGVVRGALPVQARSRLHLLRYLVRTSRMTSPTPAPNDPPLDEHDDHGQEEHHHGAAAA